GLELASQQGHLSAADLPQAIRRQPLVLVEGEDGCRPIMGRRVVGGARERGGAIAVRDAAARWILECVERREPAGEHGAHADPRRHPEERVALTELAILVAATSHECVL